MGIVRTGVWPVGAAAVLGDAFDEAGGRTRDAAVSMLRSLAGHTDYFGVDRLPKIYIPLTPGSSFDLKVSMTDLEGMLADEDVVYLVHYSREAALSAVREKLNYLYIDTNEESRGSIVIAEVHENVIFINNSTQDGMFLSLLDRVTEALRAVIMPENLGWSYGERVLSRTAAEYAEFKRAANEKKLTKFLERMQRDRTTAIQTRINDLTGNMHAHKASLIAAAKEYDNLMIELDGQRRASGSGLPEGMLNDLRELLSYENLSDIKLEGSEGAETITFSTASLSMKEQDGSGRIRPIGPYRVAVNMDTAAVTFTALDNRIDTERLQAMYPDTDGVPQHPHTNKYGVPCMGNMATVLPDLVASRDLLGIWQILLSFLTNYNPADYWGQRAILWDMYEADGVTKVNVEASKCHECGSTGYITNTAFDEDGDVLPGALILCGQCGRLTCGSCSTLLDDDTRVCGTCASDLWCDRCDSYHEIGTEMRICDECGDRVCYDTASVSEDTYQGCRQYFCGPDCQARWEEFHYYDGQDEEEEEDHVDEDEEPWSPLDDVNTEE